MFKTTFLLLRVYIYFMEDEPLPPLHVFLNRFFQGLLSILLHLPINSD